MTSTDRPCREASAALPISTLCGFCFLDAGKDALVLTSASCYSEELADYIECKGLGEAGGKFNVVGIIGGQSSGKSTLLNRMFATNFDMMDSKTGRRQTTKVILTPKHAPRRVRISEGIESRTILGVTQYPCNVSPSRQPPRISNNFLSSPPPEGTGPSQLRETFDWWC